MRSPFSTLVWLAILPLSLSAQFNFNDDSVIIDASSSETITLKFDGASIDDSLTLSGPSDPDAHQLVWAGLPAGENYVFSTAVKEAVLSIKPGKTNSTFEVKHSEGSTCTIYLFSETNYSDLVKVATSTPKFVTEPKYVEGQDATQYASVLFAISEEYPTSEDFTLSVDWSKSDIPRPVYVGLDQSSAETTAKKGQFISLEFGIKADTTLKDNRQLNFKLTDANGSVWGMHTLEVRAQEALHKAKDFERYIAIGGSFDLIEASNSVNTYSEAYVTTPDFSLLKKSTRDRIRLRRQLEANNVTTELVHYDWLAHRESRDTISSSPNKSEARKVANSKQRTYHRNKLALRKASPDLTRWSAVGSFYSASVNSVNDTVTTNFNYQTPGDEGAPNFYNATIQQARTYQSSYFSLAAHFRYRFALERAKNTNLFLLISAEYLERNTQTISTGLNLVEQTLLEGEEFFTPFTSDRVGLTETRNLTRAEGLLGLGLRFQHDAPKWQLYYQIVYGRTAYDLKRVNQLGFANDGPFAYTMQFGLIEKSVGILLGGDLRGKFGGLQENGVNKPLLTIFLAKTFSLTKLGEFLKNT